MARTKQTARKVSTTTTQSSTLSGAQRLKEIVDEKSMRRINIEEKYRSLLGKVWMDDVDCFKSDELGIDLTKNGGASLIPSAQNDLGEYLEGIADEVMVFANVDPIKTASSNPKTIISSQHVLSALRSMNVRIFGL